jgi:hypothetical protein
VFRTIGLSEQDEDGATVVKTWILADADDPAEVMATREPDEVHLYPLLKGDEPGLPYTSLKG